MMNTGDDIDDEETNNLVVVPPASTTTPDSRTSQQQQQQHQRMSTNTSNATVIQVNLSSFEWKLLGLLVISNSATVLLGRYTRTTHNANDIWNPSDMYEIRHMIIMTELLKVLLAIAMEHYASDGNVLLSLYNHICKTPKDALKMVLPAGLYLLQNTLLYVALTTLDVPVFQALYQFKLTLTAIVSVALLKRTYRPMQWVCIVCVGLGVSVVARSEQARYASPVDMHSFSISGVSAVLLAGLASSLATVYFEMIIKATRVYDPTVPIWQELVPLRQTLVAAMGRGSNNDDDNSIVDENDNNHEALVEPNTDTINFTADNNDEEHESDPPVPVVASLWMRTIQLGVFTLLIAIGQDIYHDNFEPSSSYMGTSGFLHGFTVWVWMLVVLQGFGGLLVSAVIKYADSVLKGFATSVSVIVSTLISCIFFGTSLSAKFFVGTLLIVASVAVFGLYVIVLPSNNNTTNDDNASCFPRIAASLFVTRPTPQAASISTAAVNAHGRATSAQEQENAASPLATPLLTA